MGRHRLHAAPRPGARRRTVVRNGLLGVSVAVALGTAAVTTGFVPVGGSFPYVGTDAGTKNEAGGEKSSPSSSSMEQQGGLANLSGRASSVPDPGASKRAPSASASASVTPSPSASPSTAPSPSASVKEPEKTEPATPDKTAEKETPKAEAPAKPAAPQPPKPAAPKPVAPKPVAPKPPAAKPSTPAPDGGRAAEEAAVLTLVNQARAQAGCVPVRANPPLAALAGAFSKDMAVRGFFDHTDPDGNTPWTRADKAGLSGLGGENIARGQGDAASVMQAWMNSPGHKANILNCEFRTLGVGVYLGSGGPWWTQDFGF
ncbi:CAP domain-containing protein [Streptomyces sp. NPDC101733]|uniref:CAP domain-containing protein n=1 Tax=unclassified Streptomyces TaxID=2593676 RepID=UPI00380970BD